MVVERKVEVSTKNKSQSTSNGKGVGNGDAAKVASMSSTTPTMQEEKPSTAKEEESKSSNPEPKPTNGETELVNEATSLLKSLRIKTQGPSVKVCQLRKIADGDRCVLLDGGATHCLRTSHGESEWLSSKEIKVTLADGETVLRQPLFQSLWWQLLDTASIGTRMV